MCGASLRHLQGRVEQAGPAPAKLLPPLTAVLDDRVAASDTPGGATVLGALLPMLGHLPPRKGRLGLREAVLAWVRQRAEALNALRRCDDDPYPACRADEPCALDLWPDVAAEVALGDPERYARGYFEMTGKEAGTGAYTSWLKRGIDPRVCDAACGCASSTGVRWRCTSVPSRSSSSAGTQVRGLVAARPSAQPTRPVPRSHPDIVIGACPPG